MRVLVIAEHEGGVLKSATLNTVSAALQLGAQVEVMVIGHECVAIANEASTISGVSRVLQVDAPGYQHGLPEAVAPVVVALAKNYSHIFTPATTFGKNLLPRVAAMLDVALISEVIKIHDGETFDRAIYAGNAIATVQFSEAVKLATIRPTAFVAASFTESKAIIEALSMPTDNKLSEYVKDELTQLERPELTTAAIVVAGGRALQSAENFKLIEQLADKLGAAVGASRAAVDAGFVPNDFQVGQTGKVVAPKLYIAIGISGAIQHLAGMKESKIIVAINKDEEAPIFQIADYGLVGDLFEIIPKLIELIR